MSGVNETRYLVQHESFESKYGLNKCNSKQKWIHDEFRCECKELDDWSSCDDDYMLDASTCGCELNEACEKRLFGKLVFPCEDEILNATETSLFNKKVAYEKNCCLIYTISLVLYVFLFLVVISISCYY